MPLKKKDLEKFKKRLEELKAHMTQQFKGVAAEVKTPDEGKGYSQHQADEGTDDFGRVISLELTSKEYDILRQIDRALEKIDEETYGVCDVTGQDIPLARLEAIPYATMTRDVQEKFEKGLL